ncbi:MAG: enoyl-ACP reductase FabI [Acidimicrobiales bacterium]
MGMLEGKKLLVTGVLTDASLAFGVAALAQAEGADVVLTGAGRGMSLTERTAKKLDGPPPVLEVDVTVPAQLAALGADLQSRFGRLDGVLHAIGYAPPACLGGEMLGTSWDDVSVALRVSAYSLAALVEPLLPLIEASGSASIVGLDFDAAVAWPSYNWMGVSKAALESLARYMARDLGRIGARVNLVAAGPVKTVAAKSVPGLPGIEEAWDRKAPLGWDATSSSGVARSCVALLSDWFPQTTAEIIHVDGGYHAMGG